MPPQKRDAQTQGGQRRGLQALGYASVLENVCQTGSSAAFLVRTRTNAFAAIAPASPLASDTA